MVAALVRSPLEARAGMEHAQEHAAPKFRFVGAAPRVREVGGGSDLLGHFGLEDPYQLLCRAPLAPSATESGFLATVLGDTELRRGPHLELQPLLDSAEATGSGPSGASWHASVTGTSSHGGTGEGPSLDKGLLAEAFTFREHRRVVLPEGEKGLRTTVQGSEGEAAVRRNGSGAPGTQGGTGGADGGALGSSEDGQGARAAASAGTQEESGRATEAAGAAAAGLPGNRKDAQKPSKLGQPPASGQAWLQASRVQAGQQDKPPACPQGGQAGDSVENGTMASSQQSGGHLSQQQQQQQPQKKKKRSHDESDRGSEGEPKHKKKKDRHGSKERAS